jgi:TusE/DsrC/DsvC family sulfur relay protein
METMISGNAIKVNDEGYLTDFSQWSKSIAEEIAIKEGVGLLTPKHWEIINFLQEQYHKNIPLTIRKIGSSGVTDIKEFYALFPNGPLKKAAKIAGIPKPVGCI